MSVSRDGGRIVVCPNCGSVGWFEEEIVDGLCPICRFGADDESEAKEASDDNAKN